VVLALASYDACRRRFLRVPPGGDAYLLSHIIHDWSKEQCLTILGHCRKVIKPGGRLLIAETVLPAGDARTRERFWTW